MEFLSVVIVLLKVEVPNIKKKGWKQAHVQNNQALISWAHFCIPQVLTIYTTPLGLVPNEFHCSIYPRSVFDSQLYHIIAFVTLRMSLGLSFLPCKIGIVILSLQSCGKVEIIPILQSLAHSGGLILLLGLYMRFTHTNKYYSYFYIIGMKTKAE